jgi:isoleucyl-tRNA synthetase
VVLATELTPELIRAGLSRDLVRFIQDRRKELDLERTDRIEIVIATDSDDLKQAIEENMDYIKGETLATNLEVIGLPESPDGAVEKEIGEHKFELYVAKV